jgi:hypothetical protein
LLLLAFAAGCTSTTGEPGATSDVTPGETAQQVAAEALPAAQRALSDYLAVPPDTLEMQTIEDAQWPDACLGLPASGEMCAEMITPGFLITFTFNNQAYRVRTDLEGKQVRVEAAAGQPADDELPAIVSDTITTLAGQLDVAADDVELVDFSQQDWSDSCLGLGGPAESCAAVITPGWQVMLRVNEKLYEVRADFGGDQIRVADDQANAAPGSPPQPDMEGAVIFFERSGGITGGVTTIRIFADGTVERSDGGPQLDTPVQMAVVEPAAVQTLLENLREEGYFELERSYVPADTCCDRFLYLISAEGEEEQHTVEALADAEDAPQAAWQSIDLIETFVADAFGD